MTTLFVIGFLSILVGGVELFVHPGFTAFIFHNPIALAVVAFCIATAALSKK